MADREHPDIDHDPYGAHDDEERRAGLVSLAGRRRAALDAGADLLRRLDRNIPINAYIVLLSGVAAIVFFSFLLIEPTPNWLLLAGALLIIFGMDGALRATWREPFESEGDTTPYLFLPALYVLAAPVLVDHNLSGYWMFLGAVAISAGFTVIVVAEITSVRPAIRAYPIARLVTTAAAYFVLFALASMTYVFDIDLTMALVAIALLSFMLGIEVLREGEVDPIDTLIFAGVAAAITAQARWLFHYLPLDTYPAGLLLTVVFFVTTGLLHAYVQRQFNLVLAAQYSAIAAAGLILVIYARTSGLA